MIGRFIELGLSTENILDSIGFYEDLGFQQLNVGDIWQHPYIVVGDGSIDVGLHAAELPAPMLTFVLPDLADYVNELRSRGAQFEVAKLSDDQFNELVFTDPDGHHIRLLEARTFSPSNFDSDALSLCGHFTEITMPVRDLEVASAFWQRLGCEELSTSSDPHPHTSLRGGGMVFGLHQSRDFDQLSLSFEGPNLAKRLVQLDRKGITPDTRRSPPGVHLLRSPEDLPILLHGN